jgi:hypothetical protein
MSKALIFNNIISIKLYLTAVETLSLIKPKILIVVEGIFLYIYYTNVFFFWEMYVHDFFIFSYFFFDGTRV